MTFENSFCSSFSDVSDSNILDDSHLDNEIYISLPINPTFLAEPKDLDVESIIKFNIIQSSTPPKSDIVKSQLYMQ